MITSCCHESSTCMPGYRGDSDSLSMCMGTSRMTSWAFTCVIHLSSMVCMSTACEERTFLSVLHFVPVGTLDCGVFVCMAALALAYGTDLSYSNGVCDAMRMHMLLSVMRGGLQCIPSPMVVIVAYWSSRIWCTYYPLIAGAESLP